MIVPKMIECVPNFSEGRDRAKVDRIVQAIASVAGLRVLGWEADADHHRSVVTFAGSTARCRRIEVRRDAEALPYLLSGAMGDVDAIVYI